MAAGIHVLPCPRCGQKQYTLLENVRVAAPAQAPIQTPTGYVLAQRARCGGGVLFDPHQKAFAAKGPNGQFAFVGAQQPVPPGWALVPVDPSQAAPPGLQAVQCGQLVDLPMATKGTQCPHCRHEFGAEWIAANPNDMSLGGGKGPSLRLDAEAVRVPAGANAKDEIAKKLGLGGTCN